MKMVPVLTLALLAFHSATVWGHAEAESKIFPYDYEMRDLSNGVRAVAVPTDLPNLVSMFCVVQVGSRNEVEEGYTGFAHFFEHMMFGAGTDTFSFENITAVYKNAGAIYNARTEQDMTVYHVTLPKEFLEISIRMEADRFKNIKYTEESFRIEAGAILGEYNKVANNPFLKMYEVEKNAMFKVHPYGHSTLGYVDDIRDMPNHFEYSKQFFDRFYRPERTIIVIAGDLNPNQTLDLVDQYWADWEQGNYTEEIPMEPLGTEPIYDHVSWPASAISYLTVSFRGPAFTDTSNAMPTLNVIGELGFGSSSILYSKLVLDEAVAGDIFPFNPDSTDPYLFSVFASVHDVADMWYVRDEILKTFADLRLNRVSGSHLSEVKSKLRYDFANSMSSSENVAGNLADYMARTRDPETINRVYQFYDDVSSEDVLERANEFFKDESLVVVTLAYTLDTLPEIDHPAGSVDDIVKEMEQATEEIESVLILNESPLIDFQFVFNVGAADDPPGMEGLAQLTASMIASAASTEFTYEEAQNAMFPMGARFHARVDKEMTTFIGKVHLDNLDNYYEIISSQILSPAWDLDEFQFIKNLVLEDIQNGIKSRDDEELGKEVLYEVLYTGHPYGHLNKGHLLSLRNILLSDTVSFYTEKYTRSNLVLGMAGSIPDGFLRRITIDLNKLPLGTSDQVEVPVPSTLGPKAVIVEKQTGSTAVSFGFPIAVSRSHADFAALWLACSYLGQHRSAYGVLFNRIRKDRGINYGDYAYIEYFPNGGSRIHPDTNLARQQQIFQIWIRPVETVEIAHFTTRAAMFELDKMVNNGISQEGFEGTRSFLLNSIKVSVSTQTEQLGYALDSRYYGIGDFVSHMTQELNNLTLEQVNKVIKKHLYNKSPTFVFVTNDAEELRERLANETVSIMTYQTTVSSDILEEDKLIQNYGLGLQSENVEVLLIADVFMS